MNRAVIAVADQVVVQELRSLLDQSDIDVEVAFVAESTSEMVAAVLTHRPALLFVHDRLGPGSVAPTVRDLTLRNPALAVVVVSTAGSADTYSQALDAGARAVLAAPFGLEELNHRLAALLEWSSTLRSALSDHPEPGGAGSSRGARVVAVAGAKGGVGATVIASHLAWDTATTEPGMRVCLVDLDVEKGDVPSYLDVSHRVSVADLAKISEDLASRAVADTVVVHTSGLHLLLAPTEIRDTEFVSPEAVRRILAQLRTLYHLVVVDTGSAVTTTQAAAVESADVTLQVVTADVPALRAARRQVTAWESLGVADAAAVRVVVNRFVRRSEIQQDTIDQLALGLRSQVLIPDLERGLERAGNARMPSEVRNAVWWRSLRAVGAELQVRRAFDDAVAVSRRAGGADDEVALRAAPGGGRGAGKKERGAGKRALRQAQGAGGQARGAGGQAQGAGGSAQALRRAQGAGGQAQGAEDRARRRVPADAGQVVVENVALIPVALVVLAVCLQFVLLGVSFVWSGVAAGAAARAVAVGTSPDAAARDAVPAGLRSDLRVAAGGDRVAVTVRSPMLLGSGVTRDVAVVVDHTVVREPR
ncbi:AAA family ATPase [Microlunatus capsulatus]|uniref:AAA family ATPase n=1 Tax=Microlunatus capsulatus TaxID=99117 RepID=UPI0031CDDE15